MAAMHKLVYKMYMDKIEEMEKDKGHPTRPYHITNPHNHTIPYNVNNSLGIKYISLLSTRSKQFYINYTKTRVMVHPIS